MPPKSRKLSFLDLPPPVTGAISVSSNSTDDVVPPGNPTVGAPSNLALTTAIGYSTASPTAVIDATWTRPANSTPDNYQIQISTAVTFTANGTISATTQRGGVASAHIEGLLPGTLYYVRVRANVPGLATEWTSMSPLIDNVNRITTATDTSAAGVPTGITATWIGVGDLLVTWTNPTEANFKNVQVVIRASAGGAIYRTVDSAVGRLLYPLAWNKEDTSGVGDPSLYVELRSRTFSNVLGTIVNTGLVTKAAPATPTGVAHSWSGDTANNGIAGADWTISWTRAEDAAYNRINIDSIAHYIGNSRSDYTYPFALNGTEHAGTPDATLSYFLYAFDGFNQPSTASSGTAINRNPPAPTVALTQGAVSGLYATIAGTKAADFLAYEVVWKRDGTTVATVEGADSFVRYEMQDADDGGFHSWTAVVRQKDMFAQYSTATTSSAVAFEALTLSYLRDGIVYSDSLSTSPVTLKAAFADGVTTSGGVSYNA